MIDRKILEFVESLNEVEREELIKNLRNNKVNLYCDDALMDNDEILSHIRNNTTILEINNGLTINELVEKAHENAVNKGFWDAYNNILNELWFKDYYEDVKRAFINQYLVLITREISEAVEGLRVDNMSNFREELADTFLRLADLCGGLGIDIEEEIKKKMEKNKGREKMHGKLF